MAEKSLYEFDCHYYEFDYKTQGKKIERYIFYLIKKYKFLKKTEKICLEGFGDYLLHLNLRISDLKNKNILDIGCGWGAFKRMSAKFKIFKNCVNLDRLINRYNPDVLAKSEALPFKDNVFDLVLANCSVPIMTATEAKRFDLISVEISEMIRVTKIGGIIKIYPIKSDDFKGAGDKYNALKDKMWEAAYKELQKLYKIKKFSQIKFYKFLYNSNINCGVMAEILK